MIVEGVAACKWTEETGSGKGRRTTIYDGEEKFLNSVSYLFGTKECEPTEIDIGVRTFKFECLLPENIPYSVEGEKGSVQYKVDVNLDIPWAVDVHTKKPFTVTRFDNLGLTRNSEYWMPCEQEEIKVFCCWCCTSAPLIVKVRLPRSGFGLGETIPLHVELINNSKTNVASTDFALKKVEKCTSHSPSTLVKYTKDKIVVKSGRGCDAGETVSFDETIDIPEVLNISNDRFCKVFQILYEVRIIAETAGMSVSPEFSIPITIGSRGVGGHPIPRDSREKSFWIS